MRNATAVFNLSGRKKSSVFQSIFIIIFALSTNLFATNNTLNFDGTDDYIDCGTISLSGSQITLEAWVKPESFQGNSPYITNIVGEEGDGNSAFIRFGDASLANNKPQFVLAISEQIKLDGNTELIADVWYHLAASYDGSNMRIYVNGIEDASVSQSGAFTANTTFYIANIGATGGRYFDGQIDEVRVWNDVRTEVEIRANMFSELAGDEANLVAYYKFNETSDTNADDSKSGGTYDGTLTNMAGNEWQTSPAMFGPKNCLDFDGGLKSGSPDYAYKGSNVTSNTDNFTMMAWIKPDVVTDGAGWRCVAFNGDDGGGYGFGISGSKVTGLFGTIIFHYTDEVISVGNWYHIAMRRSSATVQFFLNGELLSYSNTTAPLTPCAKFSIGNMFASGGSSLYTDSFDGQIDEVRVYDTALTDQKVRENMCGTLEGDESNLVAYYNFDNTSGTVLQSFDGSITNDLTLVNMSDDWVSSSAFNTWLNTSSSSWLTTSNWSRGSTPGSSDNVGIYSYSGGTNVSLSSSPTVNSLLFGGSSTMTLSSGVTVNGNLILESNLDLNGQTITLGSSAEFIEDGGLLSGSSGTITTTRSLSNIDENVAGLGAEITEDGNLGSTIIIRTHEAPGTSAIKRVYQITPTNDPTSATLVFHYDDSELNGQTESELELFKSSDGSTWIEQVASTISTTENTITLTGINAFSYWTAAPTGSDASLPVELSSFTTESKHANIILKWSTESEIENLGFIIERRVVSTESKMGWCELASYLTGESLSGHGSTSARNEYAYADKSVQVGVTYEYRLSDVDYKGHQTVHKPVSILCRADETNLNPGTFQLSSIYPNPFNPSTTISFEMLRKAEVKIIIYNTLGHEIWDAELGMTNPGFYKIMWSGVNRLGKDVSAGVYLISLQTPQTHVVEKAILIK